MKARFQGIRQHTLDICQPLLPEDSVAQPIVDVSPPKWHLAHTTWFFETFLLKQHVKAYKAYHEDFNYLFNSYYEGVGKRVAREQRGNITRPGLAEVLEYREYVDSHMADLLESGNPEQLEPLVELGLQHEQQHQELLWTDIKYILGNNPVFPVYNADFYFTEALSEKGKKKFISVPEGIYEIGFRGDGFCFDNELGRHKVFLHAFQFRDVLVSNEEYLAFIKDGGYNNHALWLADGWEWTKNNHIQCPLHWHYINGAWQHFTLRGMEPLQLQEAVCHISFYEADAFARWMGMRLPSEFEWEVASAQLKYGCRWEWTNSAYLAYPFYQKQEGAIGEYNGKFMINQMVLRGGSVASSEGHLRPSYRNFFPPEKQWQFTGIRLARNTP